jgi:methionine sulfoxide reductase heme-binding subunit
MLTLAAANPLWLTTRGAGAVALLLLTTTLVLGVVDVSRWSSPRWPRFVIDGIHRSAALLSVVFVAIHVATTVLDGYVSIGWLAAVVPFSSGYRTFFVGLGALAFDILLALGVTGLLRQRIGHRLWRAVHWAAYACWPVALVHALGSGSDAGRTWMLAVAGICTAAVATAVVVRVGSATGGGAGGGEDRRAGAPPRSLRGDRAAPARRAVAR